MLYYVVLYYRYMKPSKFIF